MGDKKTGAAGAQWAKPLGGEGGFLNKVGASKAHRPKPLCGEVGS